MSHVNPHSQQERKQFARKQREELQALQFSDRIAGFILRQSGPALAVKAAKWAIAWCETTDWRIVSTLLKGALENFALYDASVDVSDEVFRDTLGFPEGYPKDVKKFDLFVAAAYATAINIEYRGSEESRVKRPRKTKKREVSPDHPVSIPTR